MPAKGFRATHCKHGHELTPENRLAPTTGTRGGGACRLCHVLRTRERRGSSKTGPPSRYRQNLPARIEAEAAGLKWCPDCEQGKNRTEFNRDKRSHDGRYAYCRPCSRRRKRAEYQRLRERRLADARRFRFGITTEEYEMLAAKQEYACAICHLPCSTGRSLAVDHCHRTGVVRGLLCSKCNRGIGYFGDDRAKLEQAIQYLSG